MHYLLLFLPLVMIMMLLRLLLLLLHSLTVKVFRFLQSVLDFFAVWVGQLAADLPTCLPWAQARCKHESSEAGNRNVRQIRNNIRQQKKRSPETISCGRGNRAEITG